MVRAGIASPRKVNPQLLMDAPARLILKTEASLTGFPLVFVNPGIRLVPLWTCPTLSIYG
jgi:hypothetical protein